MKHISIAGKKEVAVNGKKGNMNKFIYGRRKGKKY
jgi:hypothetical protein